MTTTIQLGGITFHDTGTSGWIFNGLRGWYDVPDSKAPKTPIPQAHGSFDPGVDWRGSAAPTFNAIYLGDSEAEALQAWETLARLGTSPAQQVMTVTDALRATSREVSVQGMTPADHHGHSVFEVPIDLFAADPRRYAADLVTLTGLPVAGGGLAFPVGFPVDFGAGGTPGQLVLANPGNQATYSRFTVSGGGLSGGFSVIFVELGREIRFEFPVSATDVVTIDQRTGRAWINSENNSVTGYLTKAEWSAVPAEGSMTVQFNAIGSTTGTPILTAYTPPPYL